MTSGRSSHTSGVDTKGSAVDVEVEVDGRVDVLRRPQGQRLEADVDVKPSTSTYGEVKVEIEIEIDATHRFAAVKLNGGVKFDVIVERHGNEPRARDFVMNHQTS